MTDTDRLAALLHEAMCDGRTRHWTHGRDEPSDIETRLAARLVAAGVTLDPRPDDAPDVRGDVHVLTFPPHPGGFYTASALCSCGGFQWDADNVEALVAATNEVWTDFRQHIIEGTPDPRPCCTDTVGNPVGCKHTLTPPDALRGAAWEVCQADTDRESDEMTNRLDVAIAALRAALQPKEAVRE